MLRKNIFYVNCSRFHKFHFDCCVESCQLIPFRKLGGLGVISKLLNLDNILLEVKRIN